MRGQRAWMSGAHARAAGGKGAAAGGDCGRYRQSGPRPEPRLLRQPALEALKNSVRTDSPRRVGQKQLSGERSGGGGGAWSFVDSVVQLDSVEIQEVYVQGIDEVDLVSSEGSTVYRSPSPIFQETDSFDHNLRFALGSAIPVIAQEEQLYYVESPESRPPTSPRQETSASSSSGSPVHLNEDDIPLEENVNVQTTFPIATADLSPLLDDLKTSLSQCMDNAHSDILSRLHTIERGLQNTLGHQNDYFQNLIQNARQEGQNQDDLQILRLNELKKTVMAQGVTADTD
ncbi:hypothetical protein F511_43393 [Dorcoceras hygrometricum]|uniref:Uncharacterized protein n=1 Tax=Dorcoceras hygrometricum TaxID=472368 RepID=A0A2Z7BK28_9LAMI|nr:hypothetical protein F511_43393 [Dorcoceras hygrometricum]